MKKDTSETKVHSTGAMRSTAADGRRFDLIPQIGLRRLAETCHEGFVKYGAHNYRKGFAFSEMFQHIHEHLNLYLMGDRSEDHLAHIAWNVFALMEFETIHPELNDLLTAEDHQSPDPAIAALIAINKSLQSPNNKEQEIDNSDSRIGCSGVSVRESGRPSGTERRSGRRRAPTKKPRTKA